MWPTCYLYLLKANIVMVAMTKSKSQLRLFEQHKHGGRDKRKASRRLGAGRDEQKRIADCREANPRVSHLILGHLNLILP